MRAKLCLLLPVLVAGCAEVQPYPVWPARSAAVGPVSESDLVVAALLIGAAWRHGHVRRHRARDYQAPPVVLAGHPGRARPNPHRGGKW